MAFANYLLKTQLNVGCLSININKLRLKDKNYHSEVFVKMITQLIKALIVCSYAFSVQGYALSPEAIEGKAGFQLCNACHNASLNPPLAPPIWGVKRRYQKMANDRDEFIQSIVDFSKTPTQQKAAFSRAVERFGIMPAISLSNDDLEKIATYIWEEQFPPPCEHWENGAAQAIKSGDMGHAKKDQKMLEKFCNN